MIRAHRLRSLGGGLDGPLRSLPQNSVARAKPAREPEHSTLGRANPHPLLASPRGSVPLSSAGFAGAIFGCSPRTRGAQPAAVLRLALHPWGEVRKGAKPPGEPSSLTFDHIARASLHHARGMAFLVCLARG